MARAAAEASVRVRPARLAQKPEQWQSLMPNRAAARLARRRADGGRRLPATVTCGTVTVLDSRLEIVTAKQWRLTGESGWHCQ